MPLPYSRAYDTNNFYTVNLKRNGMQWLIMSTLFALHKLH